MGGRGAKAGVAVNGARESGSIYEVVKTVNGYDITRMVGSRGFYTLRIDERRSMSFRSVKEAEAWANAHKR